MAYDPFARGPYPVGVRTLELADGARAGRALPTEFWYPAADAYAGRDLGADTFELLPGFPSFTQDAVRDAVPRAGRPPPLVVFSHGYTAHRRQSTFLCTHLASHGYVVASADHTGNTVLEVVQGMMTGRFPDPAVTLRESIAARPADVTFVVDRVIAGEADGIAIDARRIGVAGHSFGGWTTLMATARDRRIRAALPLAPAGGENPLGANVLGETLDFSWGRDVPTLFIVADQDNILPLPGMHELHGRTQATKQMVILQDADHLHFCDNVEQVHELFRTMPTDPLFAPAVAKIRPIGELCPGAHAHDLVRGLGLAHMDAVLRGDERAAALLGGDVRGMMAERGVRVDVR